MKGSTGFTFRGIHSSDLGILVKTINRTLLPQVKHFEISPPEIDGSFDFSAANGGGRPMYENRVFEAELFYTADNIQALQTQNSRVAAWLAGGKDRLVFDDMPDVYWMAKVAGQINYAPQNNGSGTNIKVIFNAEPFSYGFDYVTVLNPASMTPFKVRNGATLIAFDNLGTAYTRPVISMNAACSGVSITHASGTLSITGALNELHIDCEEQIVNRSPAVKTTGRYPECLPGKNTFEVRLNMSGEQSLNISYLPRYMYGVVQ